MSSSRAYHTIVTRSPHIRHALVTQSSQTHYTGVMQSSHSRHALVTHSLCMPRYTSIRHIHVMHQTFLVAFFPNVSSKITHKVEFKFWESLNRNTECSRVSTASSCECVDMKCLIKIAVNIDSPTNDYSLMYFRLAWLLIIYIVWIFAFSIIFPPVLACIFQEENVANDFDAWTNK